MPDAWTNGLIGGAMIGAAAGLLLLANGRIAGISGVAGEVVDGALAARVTPRWIESALFVAGLLLAPLVFAILGGSIEIRAEAPLLAMVAGGLAVGVGARLGSGCTSGHGVCGAARLSARSWVGMAVFMVVAILTVAVGRLV